MPTYVNTTNKRVSVGDVVFQPRGKKEFVNYINLYGMSKEIMLHDHKPYYNPVNAVYTVTSDQKAVDIQDFENTDTLEVYNSSTFPVTVFLNSEENKPGIIVPPSTIRYINRTGGKVIQLVLEYTSDGSGIGLYITELQNREFTELRGV